MYIILGLFQKYHVSEPQYRITKPVFLEPRKNPGAPYQEKVKNDHPIGPSYRQ